MDVTVSQLDPKRTAHVDLYRSVRLRSLNADPDAFGADLERESAFTADEWQRRVAGFGGRPGAVLVARLSAALQFPATSSTAVGVVGIGASPSPTDATLWGMWVAPTGRGHGVSAALLDAADQWATVRGRSTITLWVNRTNDPAIGLYERRGYRPIDPDEHGVVAPDSCSDEICMRLPLASN